MQNPHIAVVLRSDCAEMRISSLQTTRSIIRFWVLADVIALASMKIKQTVHDVVGAICMGHSVNQNRSETASEEEIMPLKRGPWSRPCKNRSGS
jgi:hypothetical protein